MSLKSVTAGFVLVAVAFGCGGTHATRAVTTQSQQPLRWLDELDDRYRAFKVPLARAEWQRAVGDTVEDTQRAAQQEREFLDDTAVRKHLELLADDGDPQVSARSRAWLRFLGSRTARSTGVDVITRRITAEVLEPGAGELMTLYRGADSSAREPAWRRLEERTRALLPLLAERARTIDVTNPDALDGVRAMKDAVLGTRAVRSLCETQTARTRTAFVTLLERVRSRVQRAPEPWDMLAESVAWTTEGSAFLESERHHALAVRAFRDFGFDVEAMHIEVRHTANPGGAAYDIDAPDDVRFHGFFPAGFEGARGYLHELGHAVHMKRIAQAHFPDRLMPQDRALGEGIGEIFTLPLRDRSWLSSVFPDVRPAGLDAYLTAVAAFDAYAVRANCLHALIEMIAHEGGDVGAEWPSLYEGLFEARANGGPAYVLLPYLKTPLYTRQYVLAQTVVDTFVHRLGKTPLVSHETGRALDSMLRRGNNLALVEYLH